MKFSQALASMKAGDKVRKKDWKKGLYVHLVNNCIRFRNGGGLYTVPHDDILDIANEWEIYKSESLSDKMVISVDVGIFYEEDVKKFIDKVRNNINTIFTGLSLNSYRPEETVNLHAKIAKMIDDEAGDKLI